MANKYSTSNLSKENIPRCVATFPENVFQIIAIPLKVIGEGWVYLMGLEIRDIVYEINNLIYKLISEFLIYLIA